MPIRAGDRPGPVPHWLWRFLPVGTFREAASFFGEVWVLSKGTSMVQNKKETRSITKVLLTGRENTHRHRPGRGPAWVRPSRPGPGNHFFSFSQLRRHLRPPRRGAAAGGAVLVKGAHANIDFRAQAGPLPDPWRTFAGPRPVLWWCIFSRPVFLWVSRGLASGSGRMDRCLGKR